MDYGLYSLKLGNFEIWVSNREMGEGVENVNAQKMCKYIMELERIYRIKNGGDRKWRYEGNSRL